MDFTMKNTTEGKLRVMFLIAILAIALMGAFAYISISQTLQTFNTAIRSGAQISILGSSIHDQMLLHRRYEKDFLLNIGDTVRQASYLDRFREVSFQMKGNLKKLKELIQRQDLLSHIALPDIGGKHSDEQEDSIYKEYLEGASQARRIDLRKRINSVYRHYEKYLEGFYAVVDSIKQNPAITPQEGNIMMLPYKTDIYELEYASDDAYRAGKVLLNQLSTDVSMKNNRNQRIILYTVFVTILMLIGIAVLAEISFRKTAQAVKAHNRSELFLDDVFNAIQDGISVIDTSFTITRVNKAMEERFGKNGSLVGKKCFEAYQNCDHICEKCPAPQALSKGIRNSTQMAKHEGQGRKWLDLSVYPLKDSNQRVIGAIEYFKDITEERLLQEQLAHSQKMESIGMLAGGVAHDFNNILAGISGYAQVLSSLIPEEPPKLKQYAEKIISSSFRAAKLTRQLLTFARKARCEMKPIDIHECIEHTMGMLKHTVDKRIELTKDLQASQAVVRGDVSQIENCFLNISINARDAMPEGGRLSFATKEVELAQDSFTDVTAQVAAGKYLQITITDTGCGMDRKTVEKVFEPFFTTKEVGQGTGLGLSSVYGSIKQHGGYILVDSVLAVGTTITIYLPLLELDLDQEQFFTNNIVQSGSGKVLVVDDEEAIRETVSAMLKEMGYEVRVCINGLEAVECYKKDPAAFRFIILDLMMPKLSGIDCFRKLKNINPGLLCLVATGFANNNDEVTIQEEGAAAIIRKPFTIAQLSEAVSKTVAA